MHNASFSSEIPEAREPESVTMQPHYRVLRNSAVILVLWGGCALFCMGAAEDALNQKAEEMFAAAIQVERQGNNPEAEKAFNHCIYFARENKLYKLETLSLYRLAILKAKEQKFAESEKLFREVIQRKNDDVAILCDFAKLFSDQKKFSDAETVLKNAVLIAPDNRRVLFNLGCVIASQKDRETEGLRYLKLSIGEVAAYRELAKIFRLSGNQGQAEFAEQRAFLLEKNQPPSQPDSLTSQVIPMDAKMKKEIIGHVKEELLRLETAEIGEEQHKMSEIVQSFVQNTPQQIPLPPLSESLTQNPQPSQPIQSAQPALFMVSEILPANQNSASQPAFDPISAFVGANKSNHFSDSFVETAKKKEVTELPNVMAPPRTAEQPRIVEPSGAYKPSETVETPLPKLAILPQPKPALTQQTLKPLPQFATQESPKVQKPNTIRTLPATENQVFDSSDSSTTNSLPQKPESIRLIQPAS